jgi:hypothetical protein
VLVATVVLAAHSRLQSKQTQKHQHRTASTGSLQVLLSSSAASKEPAERNSIEVIASYNQAL